MNKKVNETENLLKWLDHTFEYCKFGKPPLSIDDWICLQGGWVRYYLHHDHLPCDCKCDPDAGLC